jgi:hypothetical protein
MTNIKIEIKTVTANRLQTIARNYEILGFATLKILLLHYGILLLLLLLLGW